MSETGAPDNNVVPINTGRFGVNGRKGGRTNGAINKHTRILKDALMLAAEIEGMDGHGKGKLVGFLRRVAQEDMRAFCALLGRVIPLQAIESRLETTAPDAPYKTLDEFKRELASRGFSIDVALKIASIEDNGESIDNDEFDDWR